MMASRQVLLMLWWLCALACVVTVFVVPGSTGVESTRHWPLVIAPFAAFAAVHVLLMYDSWKRSSRRTLARGASLAAITILAIAFLVVLVKAAALLARVS